MTTYSVQPLNYINDNLFTTIPSWEINSGGPAQLFFQLFIHDALGERRYLPPAGTQVTISFIRSRAPTVDSKATSITKYAVQILPTSDKSIYQVDLTPAETSLIITGGIKLSLVMSGVETSFNLPHMVKKVVASPGF